MRLFTLLLAAVLTAGCGVAQLRQQVTALQRQVAEERQQRGELEEANADLTAQLVTEGRGAPASVAGSADSDGETDEARSAPPTKRPSLASPFEGPAVRPVARPMPPGIARRPLPLRGPPPQFGSMHGPVPAPGCTTGILSMGIQNNTPYFLRILLDGVAVQVGGGAGILPLLPPGQTVDVCLGRPGTHTISGMAYIRRSSEFVEYGRFHYRRSVSHGTMATWGRQHHSIPAEHIRPL